MSKEPFGPVPLVTARETEDREGGERKELPREPEVIAGRCPGYSSRSQTPNCRRRSHRGAGNDPAVPFRPLPQPAHRPATCSPAHKGGIVTPGPHGNTRPGRPQPPCYSAVHLAPSPPQLGGLRLALQGTRVLGGGGGHCSPAVARAQSNSTRYRHLPVP